MGVINRHFYIWLSLPQVNFPGGQCRSYKRHGFNSWSGRSPGVGNGNPLQYSCMENSMSRGAWSATVQGFAKSQTQLSDWACTHARGLLSWVPVRKKGKGPKENRGCQITVQGWPLWKREGRKEDWTSRISDYRTILRVFQPNNTSHHTPVSTHFTQIIDSLHITQGLYQSFSCGIHIENKTCIMVSFPIIICKTLTFVSMLLMEFEWSRSPVVKVWV